MRTGKAVDLPLKIDADKGGLVPNEKIAALPSGEFDGRCSRQMGIRRLGWTAIPTGDRTAGRVERGRDRPIGPGGGPRRYRRISTAQTSDCVEKVTAQIDEDPAVTLAWKSPKPSELEVTLPLKEAEPGPVNLEIDEFGMAKPDRLKMVAYAAAASLDGLTLNSGDKIALLKGTRLDEVAKAEVGGVTFTPSTLDRVENLDQLQMNSDGSTDSLEAGKSYVALVDLKDGRTLKAPVIVDPPRPQVTLLNEGIQQDGAAPSPVEMSSPADLPVDGRLVFFLKSDVPADFPRDEKIEVAAADSSFHTTLALSDGSLMLEDAHTAEASLEPLARFGSSAFGPVRVRAISADGATGDWVPLGTLVRIPGFKELRCPRATAKPCILSGTDLFLATSISATASFDSAVNVPPEFTGTELVVPHPAKGVLYLKLRDDPANAETLTLPVTLMAGPAPTTPAGSERRRQHRRPRRPRRLRWIWERKPKRPRRGRTERPRGRAPPALAAKTSAPQRWGSDFLWWVEAPESKADPSVAAATSG